MKCFTITAPWKLEGIIRFAVLLVVDFLATSKPVKVSRNTILLVRLDAIGDYILFRNFIEVIKKSEKFKDYKITLCGNVAWKELAEVIDKEFVDGFIWIDTKRFNRNIFYRYNLMRTISRKGFEVAIQPTFSRVILGGDAVIKASNAKERIGSQGDYSNIRPWQKRLSDRWYTHLVPASAEPMMEIRRNAEFAHNLGLTSLPAELPVIKITDGTKRIIEEDEYYILCPGASRTKKCWPLERFAQLAEKIYDATGWAGVICGDKDEEKLGQGLKNLSCAPLRNIAGKTSLSELVRVVHNARLIVANDTGTVHIAVAVRTPVVCILGGGHYGRFMPYPVEQTTHCRLPIAVTHKMPCFGCNWQCKYNVARSTPCPCIKNISVENVWAQVNTLVEQISAKRGLKSFHE